MGWKEVGDLSTVEPNRESIKEAVNCAYPGRKPMSNAVSAGQLFRFLHEMQDGDFVVYPSKADRKIHVGVVTGGYEFSASAVGVYVHQRPIEWRDSFPRTLFSQGALYEIGSALSFFSVKNYVDEFHAVLDGKAVSSDGMSDETVSLVAEEIEETTKDFILKQLAKELKGHKFEHFVAHLLERMGYRARVTRASVDGGIDIIAHRDELGFEPPIIKVQVKATEGTVGDPQVSALYGKVDSSEFGLLVTLGSYSKQAVDFASNKSNLRLINGEELVELILDQYERFDPTYQGILPLRKVFIPQSTSSEDSE